MSSLIRFTLSAFKYRLRGFRRSGEHDPRRNGVLVLISHIKANDVSGSGGLKALSLRRARPLNASVIWDSCR